ncbi:MAG: type II secretion system protein GspI [Proteobacteria bacterium]|jgi:general secretion pathway protein I|nr:type II secretion system minor pseudopilin GspI [Gammaproteobacteria bacterium]NBW83932.1 type II secretion system protein GspI [Pseudomonadota bacterium]
MYLQRGFSLLEVGVALLILGLAVTSIFQFISSTTLSTFNLEDRAYARQIANNRLALAQTLEPMIGNNERQGQVNFGGKIFFWSETINQSSDQMNEIRILVGKNKKATLYELRVFIEKK